MRAYHIAVIAAALAMPSVGHAQVTAPAGAPVGQDNGPVSGKVGADLGASQTKPGPSLGAPYGTPPRPGPRAGNLGAITPGQVVPQNVPITPRQGGMGSAFIDGHRVLVDPNTNRILRVFN